MQKAIKKLSKKKLAELEKIAEQKYILDEIPQQKDIQGKTWEELDDIWRKIIRSERALDRKHPDFITLFNLHCEGLRAISRERRKIKNIPEP